MFRGAFCGFMIVAVGVILAASTASPAAAEGPLKVFVLAGQSNMRGHAKVRTLAAMKLDPRLAPQTALM